MLTSVSPGPAPGREKVRSGSRNFSFVGQPVGYRFKPDGSWETIPISVPPKDGAVRPDFAPGERPNKRQQTVTVAEHFQMSRNGWVWGFGAAAASIAGLAWFLLGRKELISMNPCIVFTLLLGVLAICLLILNSNSLAVFAYRQIPNHVRPDPAFYLPRCVGFPSPCLFAPFQNQGKKLPLTAHKPGPASSLAPPPPS